MCFIMMSVWENVARPSHLAEKLKKGYIITLFTGRPYSLNRCSQLRSHCSSQVLKFCDMLSDHAPMCYKYLVEY